MAEIIELNILKKKIYIMFSWIIISAVARCIVDKKNVMKLKTNNRNLAIHNAYKDLLFTYRCRKCLAIKKKSTWAKIYQFSFGMLQLLKSMITIVLYSSTWLQYYLLVILLFTYLFKNVQISKTSIWYACFYAAFCAYTTRPYHFMYSQHYSTYVHMHFLFVFIISFLFTFLSLYS